MLGLLLLDAMQDANLSRLDMIALEEIQLLLLFVHLSAGMDEKSELKIAMTV